MDSERVIQEKVLLSRGGHPRRLVLGALPAVRQPEPARRQQARRRAPARRPPAVPESPWRQWRGVPRQHERLIQAERLPRGAGRCPVRPAKHRPGERGRRLWGWSSGPTPHSRRATNADAIDRKSGGSGKRVSVLVDHGGRRYIKQKHNELII